MTVGNKVTAYNKNDELFRTDTLNTDTEEDSVVIYKYDKNGNQLATVNRYEIPSDKKDSTYVDIDVTLGDNRLNENVVNHYNALNQLTQTLTKNYKVRFIYDAEGLRTSKTVNGEKTVFVWDEDQLVMELSGSGKMQKRYIRGNDLVYADKGENTEKQYYVTDPHGNVVQLTDESGKITKTYEYDSFGNETNRYGKDDNPFRYCCEYYDKETEEIYLRARYYQPTVGRFLTRDTYTGEEDEPMSLHLYTYCYNNPVVYFDNGGNCPIVDWAKSFWNWITGGNKSNNNKSKVTPKPTVAPTATPQVTAKPKVKKTSKVYAIAASDSGKHRKYLTKKQQLKNAKYIKSYFEKKKWSINAICGLLGNIYEECGMNPGLWQYWNDVTYAYGLLQWDDATNFLNRATSKKLTPKDVNSMASDNPKKLMDLQLKYFEKTMGGKYNTWYQTTAYYGCIKMSVKKYKKSKKKAEKLAYIFHGSYERSGDTDDEIKERGKAAKKYHNKFNTTLQLFEK